MTRPAPITRNQLAEFLPNQRTIKAFEQLLRIVGEDTPSDIDAVALDASLGLSTAAEISQLAYSFMRYMELAKTPSAQENHLAVDYIDFAGDPPHVAKSRRMAWNADEETLDLHHNANVTQQVGYALYAFTMNNSGATINGGEVIYIANSDGTYPTSAKFIADGTILGQRCLGVMTETVANGTKGRANRFGLVRGFNASGSDVSETWSAGDPLYASTTTAGKMTKVKPTAPNLSIPIGFVVNNSSTAGSVFVNPIIEQQKFYGFFTKTSDSSPVAINTGYPIILDNTIISSGVVLGTPASRIVCQNAGLYAFTTSYQWSSTSASVKNVWLWYKKNGTDVANSALKISLESNTALSTPSRRRLFSMAAGDYIEVYYASDSTNVTLDALAATAFAPDAPAFTITVEQIQQ